MLNIRKPSRSAVFGPSGRIDLIGMFFIGGQYCSLFSASLAYGRISPNPPESGSIFETSSALK